MPLQRNGLLNEYLFSSRTYKYFGGKKCDYDTSKHAIRINNQLGLICFAIHIIFGIFQEIHTLPMVMPKIFSNTFQNSENYRSVGIIIFLGTLYCGAINVNSILNGKLFEEFVNNLLRIENLHQKHLGDVILKYL